MIDNLDSIIPFLKFESEDDFYYLQILQRKKENPQLGSNSRVIKNYYIRSVDYLIQHYDEIKKLCEVFNARASIRLNKRSFYKTSFKTMENIAHNMSNKDFMNISKSYDRACGLGHNDSEKKWILDIDERNLSTVKSIGTFIENIEPKGNKVLVLLDSKNGFHLITKPFNLQNFSKKYPEIEVHKDNPTNLYIP